MSRRVVTVEQLEALEALAADYSPPPPPPPPPALPDLPTGPAERVSPSSMRPSSAKRCAAYLAKVPPSIQGQHGSQRIYQAARVIWNDFGLDDFEGYPLLEEFNQNSQPPWLEEGKQGLRRKWDEAVKKGPGPEGRGYRLRQNSNNWEPRSNANGFHPQAPPAPGPPGPQATVPTAAAPAPDEKANAIEEPKKPRWPAPEPISQLTGEAAAVDWLWRGCIARRHVTLFSALMKAGKSTLVGHLLRALQDGKPFVGLPTQPCRTLVVSEESRAIWKARRDLLGLDDSLAVMCRPMMCKPTFADWFDFVAYLGTCCVGKFDLVVIDTLTSFAPWENENSSAEVQATLTPLNQLTELGLAVNLFHHFGKMDGSDGRAARGSTALAAGVDVLLEMRRFNPGERSDRRRVLSGLGRFDEVPDELVISLADDGSEYLAEGSKRDIEDRALHAAIIATLPQEPPGKSAEEIHTDLPEDCRPARGHLSTMVRKWAKAGFWTETGAGKKGSPYRFWRAEE